MSSRDEALAALEGAPAEREVVDGLWPGSIGSDTLPGLSKLGEECGELTEIVNKIWGSGGTQHWTGDLKIRLEEEIADVAASIEFVVQRNDLDTSRISDRVNKKFLLFQKWHREARPCRSGDTDCTVDCGWCKGTGYMP